MDDFKPEKRLGVLGRLGDAVREAMGKLPDLENPASRSDNPDLSINDDEEGRASSTFDTGSEDEIEIARFVGEGGLPNPSEDS